MISVSGNLNAKDNVYVPKAYSEKLDELIEDPNTNNIAVTCLLYTSPSPRDA